MDLPRPHASATGITIRSRSRSRPWQSSVSACVVARRPRWLTCGRPGPCLTPLLTQFNQVFPMFSQRQSLSSRLKRSLPFACLGMGICLLAWPSQVFAEAFRVTPAQVRLTDNFALTRLIVTKAEAGGNFSDRSDDLTTTAHYASSNPAVVTVTKTGKLRPAGNGQAEIFVTVNGTSQTARVTVEGFQSQPDVGFVKLVMPMLTKSGCNLGACHGLQDGKGGFKLSVFESSPREDHDVMVRAHGQRRVNLLIPEESLLLQKPLRQIGHGGGQRFERGSVAHAVFLAWIRAGNWEIGSSRKRNSRSVFLWRCPSAKRCKKRVPYRP